MAVSRGKMDFVNLCDLAKARVVQKLQQQKKISNSWNLMELPAVVVDAALGVSHAEVSAEANKHRHVNKRNASCNNNKAMCVAIQVFCRGKREQVE
jgi:hypothetical protein